MNGPSQSLREEGFYEFKKNSSEGLCWVKGCSRDKRDKRSLCRMHDMRRWRSKNRQTAGYCTLRDHARARGVEFSISLEYWAGVTDAFAFYEAREDEVLTIDRIDATKGYVEKNIRVVSISMNTMKSIKERYLPEHVQHMIERRREKMRAEAGDLLSLGCEEPDTWDAPDLFDENIDDENPF